MNAGVIGRASLTERAIIGGREVLLGRRRGLAAMLPFAGPAVIASVAYGNLKSAASPEQKVARLRRVVRVTLLFQP
jgi:hypothetical protein